MVKRSRRPITPSVTVDDGPQLGATELLLESTTLNKLIVTCGLAALDTSSIGRPVCQVVTMDLPGHGERAPPTGTTYGELTLEDYAAGAGLIHAFVVPADDMVADARRSPESIGAFLSSSVVRSTDSEPRSGHYARKM